MTLIDAGFQTEAVHIIIISIIMHAFITCASSVMILNHRRWQSLGGQHGKGVDALFEKVSFRRRLKVSKVRESLILRGSPFQTVAAK